MLLQVGGSRRRTRAPGRIRALPLLAGLALLALSCGGGPPPGEGVVRVTFWHAMGGPLGDVLEDSLIAEFNATHPGIEVVPVAMGNYRALSQKIMASVMAGDTPSIAQAYETWTAQLVRGDAIVPMDSLMALDPGFTDEIWPDVYEVFREDNTFDGRIYSLPFNKSVPLVYYNADLFESLGLSPAQTLDGHRALLRALTLDGNSDGDLLDDCDRWGTAFTGSVWTFECLLSQFGGSLIDSSSGSVAFDSPEGEQALGFLQALLHEDRTAYLATGFDHQRQFSAGRVALIEASVTSLAFLKKDMQSRAASGLSTFRIGVAPLPSGVRRSVFIAGTNVVIFRSDDPREIAASWEFAKWFLEPRQQARWFAGSGYLPAVRGALSEPEAIARIEANPGLDGVIGQLDYALFEPQTSAWYEGREFLSEAIEIALYGRMSAGEALSRAARLTDAEIAAGR
ncbi:MAG TPA: ABC transporter substrate-binding protein [Candidatus Fermentibacter daniensis]|nr:ABC transporter substrate-binding protein [Candidatus Fermentibacter daniensis]HOZ17523.1 ABC transporter substrate-binding protein [Candidatus Fermentibacter daniensis]